MCTLLAGKFHDINSGDDLVCERIAFKFDGTLVDYIKRSSCYKTRSALQLYHFLCKSKLNKIEFNCFISVQGTKLTN